MLVIRKEFQNYIITMNGIKLDCAEADPSDYEFYYSKGFDVFEEFKPSVKEVIQEDFSEPSVKVKHLNTKGKVLSINAKK